MMFDEYQDRVGELITGIVQQSDSRYTLVQLRERVEALLPRSEQVGGERYDHGARVKAIITDVSAQAKGPSIIVSRRSPELIRKLFELEVPEIADGLVEIQNVAREPGYRSKIAVVSHTSGVDPVGACVGPRGSRVRMVVSELRGEKIDIIPFNEEPARFVAKALSPARVREVLVDDEAMQATVIVPDDQLSLAIGKDGLNARLAARLTGWRVDIRSETEFAEEEADDGLRGGGGRRALRRDPRQRQALPERLDPGLALLRPAGPPGARATRRAIRSAAARPRTSPTWRRLRRGGGSGRARRRPSSEEACGRRGGAGCRGGRVLGTAMAKKRVHEIAKEKGIPSKEVLAILQEAGLDVKAAASSVDEDDIAMAFDPASAGGRRPRSRAQRRRRRPRRRAEGRRQAQRRAARTRRGESAPAAERSRRRVVIDSQASRRSPGPPPQQQTAAAPPRPPPPHAVGRARPHGQARAHRGGARSRRSSRAPRSRRSPSRWASPPPEVIKKLMELGEMATLTQTLSDEAIEVLADGFDKKVEIQHAADEVADEPEYDDADERPGRAPAGGHDHGPRRPRQDLAARRHPRDRGGRGRGRRHHPAHRRLPGAPRRPHGHLPRHPGPRGLHRHARPRRPGGRHRGRGRGRRRRRDAPDRRGRRPRQGGRGADHGRGQQDRQGGRGPQPRPRRAGPAGPDPGRLGRRHRVRRRVRQDPPEPRRAAGDADHARRHPGAQGQPRRRGVGHRDRVAPGSRAAAPW